MGQGIEFINLKKNLNEDNWSKWKKNTLLFSTPTLLVILITLQNTALQATSTGEFLPSKEQMVFLLGSVQATFLGSVIDYLKKFNQDNK